MFSLETIKEITGAEWIQKINNPQIKHLITDSRKVAFEEDALFFALQGSTYNGNDFIGELYNKGVRNFVVSIPVELEFYPESNFLFSENPLLALQQIASRHRQNFKLPVTGITGSNGKTVVKEWLYQLLWQDFQIVRSPKSYNSQLGVPLSVWQIDQTHRLAIFEAGISQPNEMQNLQKIIKPDIGILTNIGQAHNEGFTSLNQKVTEKLSLFSESDFLIYCADYPVIEDAITLLKSNPLNQGLYHFSQLAWTCAETSDNSDENAHIVLRLKVEFHSSHTNIRAWYKKGTPFSFQIPFTDEASVENAIHCLMMMLHLNVPLDKIVGRMGNLVPVEMRLELRAGINRSSLINDAYNSDIHSLSIALDFLQKQHQHQTKTLILSDILETGEQPEMLYQKVAKLLAQKKINRFIGIGQTLSSMRSLFSQFNAGFYPTTPDFLRRIPSFSNEAILIKGARPFAFEKIVQVLSAKAHNTTLEINLNAIAHNLKVYQSLLKPDTKIMVMVKSLSYGSGGHEIANVLQQNKADYLAVAYTDEGVALREAGITLPVMVMSPNADSFNALVRHQLEPELFSLSHLAQFAAYLYHTPVQVNFPYPIHLKLDTGMHRLGFEEGDLPDLLKLLEKNPQLKIVSVFTHLAASDNPEHDYFTNQQINLFSKIADLVQEQTKHKFLRHVLNSSGITRFPDEVQMDMVRLGIGLYGIDNTKHIQTQLQNVSTLKTHISQLKRLQPNQTVGYNRKGKVNRPSVIATLPIGYADGLNRHLSNGVGQMMVNQQLAPIIGNICMDMTMLDVTAIKQVKEGDEVIVFGESLPVQNIANRLNTIPYEILTGISNRVKRIYFQE